MKDSDWAILDTLYREPNITKAADLLFMTQPSLTKRLQQIEKEFTTTIAIRNPKGIVLTAQGEYLAIKAGEMLRKFKEIQQEIMEMNDGNKGTLKLGVNNSYGRFRLPSLLNQYKSMYPNINFEIANGLSSDVLKMVNLKEINIGFIRGDHEFDGMKQLISVDPSYIVSKKEIPFEDLPYIPRIEYQVDPLTVKLLDHWWNEHFTVPPLKGLVVNHGDTCREMIANGLGYGIFLVPEFIEGAVSLYKQPMHTKDKRPFTRNTWMIYNKDSSKIPFVRNFIDFVSSQTDSLK
ncbi:LysR family transcriptional regulator [Desulfosporosinus shakirovi]|uniref:LysR family transcriptional regulator n=1 Tax=Desulfosporosinus shakirovi TaxID=2885154 RepID=UPI001E2F8C1A|nr:LysR family transcriptional regulator [Desulfosporosinus sp. SRJS8]MCB8815152.1 LysR family transcriptional regulator [Desulfosporosinus sp. SRJS8]